MSRLRHLWLTLRLTVPPLAWLTLLIGLCAGGGGLWLQHDQASLVAGQRSRRATIRRAKTDGAHRQSRGAPGAGIRRAETTRCALPPDWLSL